MAVKPQFRLAEQKDLFAVGRLVREFYQKAGAVYGIPYSHEDTLALVAGVIQNGVCLVGASSCAGAILAPFPFNRQAIVAYVPFWYFQTAREIQIIEALAALCRGAGATHINVASHFPDNRIGRRYARLGLVPVEAQHLGSLNNACIGR